MRRGDRDFRGGRRRLAYFHVNDMPARRFDTRGRAITSITMNGGNVAPTRRGQQGFSTGL